MAAFDCKVVPIDKLVVEPRGVKEPLCNDCVQPDCDNPIRKQTISVMGSPVNWRLWVVNNSVRQVVQCAGYMSGDADDTMGSYISGPQTTTEGSEIQGPEGNPA
jgi:hypothetical protein